LDKSVTINGKSQSLFDNYNRQLAHLALHYGQLSLDLSGEQVTDYLYLIKKDRDISESFFRFTSSAMRYICKMRGLDYRRMYIPGFEMSNLSNNSVSTYGAEAYYDKIMIITSM
jgi:hypothetical protein